MKTRIYVSNKIKRVYRSLNLNPLPEKAEMESHDNSWNANFLAIENKKCWVLTHTKTRYTVIVPDVTAKKSNELKFWFMDHLISQFLKDHPRIDFEKNVNPVDLDRFFGEFEFYPTNNDRSSIASNNRRIEELQWHKHLNKYDDIPFYSFGAHINHYVKVKRNGKTVAIEPVKEMLELIKGNT